MLFGHNKHHSQSWGCSGAGVAWRLSCFEIKGLPQSSRDVIWCHLGQVKEGDVTLGKAALLSWGTCLKRESTKNSKNHQLPTLLDSEGIRASVLRRDLGNVVPTTITRNLSVVLLSICFFLLKLFLAGCFCHTLFSHLSFPPELHHLQQTWIDLASRWYQKL